VTRVGVGLLTGAGAGSLTGVVGEVGGGGGLLTGGGELFTSVGAGVVGALGGACGWGTMGRACGPEPMLAPLSDAAGFDMGFGCGPPATVCCGLPSVVVVISPPPIGSQYLSQAAVAGLIPFFVTDCCETAEFFCVELPGRALPRSTCWTTGSMLLPLCMAVEAARFGSSAFGPVLGDCTG